MPARELRFALGFVVAILATVVPTPARAQEPTLGDAPRAERPAFTAPKETESAPAPSTAAARGWIDTNNRSAVLTAYHNTFGPAVPAPGWTGDIGTCNAGTLAADHRASALGRVNWYRGMAGVLDGVVEDAGFTTLAQEAALLMAANRALSHDPPPTWTCYTTAGDDGAGRSNLYIGRSGVGTIDGFVDDQGANNAPVGHRGWILEPTQVRMGFGSIPVSPESAALHVVDSANLFPSTPPPVRESTGFVSWPPRGFVPGPKVYPRWSLHKQGADFSGASVQVTVGGSPVATNVEWRGNVAGGSKPSSVLTFIPSLPAFPAQSDLVVAVTVTGIAGAGIPTSYSWTSTVIPPTTPVSSTRAVADFDGNGTSDISVFRPASGSWLVKDQATGFLGVSGDLPVPCDYNGNGVTDRAVFRPSVGGWYIEGQAPVFFGLNGDIPVPGHYTGSSSCIIAVFRPSVGGWYIQGQPTVFFGLSGDIPVPADYDGNGTTDVAVFRPSVGGWYRNGATTTFFGLNGDIPVPGDYDGNGGADVAIFRRAVGGWYVQGQSPQFLGLNDDVPVPGDYNGNGSTEVAVFRPSTGAWYVATQGPTFHGTGGDVPLPLPAAIRIAFFP